MERREKELLSCSSLCVFQRCSSSSIQLAPASGDLEYSQHPRGQCCPRPHLRSSAPERSEDLQSHTPLVRAPARAHPLRRGLSRVGLPSDIPAPALWSPSSKLLGKGHTTCSPTLGGRSYFLHLPIPGLLPSSFYFLPSKDCKSNPLY